jgi:hypothetical protein
MVGLYRVKERKAEGVGQSEYKKFLDEQGVFKQGVERGGENKGT